MALSERHRVVLHTKLTEAVGDEEAVSEMLSHFPVDDLDRPATESFVRTEIATVRTEMAQMETRLKDFVHDQITNSMRWTLGTFLTFQTVVIALVVAFT